jgi:hypothetical protein
MCRTIALGAVAATFVMGCSLTRANTVGGRLEKWTGVAPNAGLVYDDGMCGQDIEFELARTGDALNGWIRFARVLNGNCPSILSLEQTTRQLAPTRISGTLKRSAVSLTIMQARTNYGVPNRITVIVISGTLKDDQLTMTGIQHGPRTWIDLNRDGIPNCDLAVRDTNGECARDIAQPRPVTFRAKRISPG